MTPPLFQFLTLESCSAKPGDIVYSQHGQEAEYVAQAPMCSHVVLPLYEGDEGPRYGDAETWQKVFTTPPTPRLEKQIGELEARAHSLQDEVAALQKQKREVISTDAALLKKLESRSSALKGIENFLDGKWTHAIRETYRGIDLVEIPAGLEVADEDRYSKNKPLKLLTLYGKSDGNLEWRLASYSDGSGSSWTVKLFFSYDEAVAYIHGWLEAQAGEFRTKTDHSRPSAVDIISAGEKYGWPVPDDIRQFAANARRASNEERIAKLQKEIEEIRAKDPA